MLPANSAQRFNEIERHGTRIHIEYTHSNIRHGTENRSTVTKEKINTFDAKQRERGCEVVTKRTEQKKKIEGQFKRSA